MQMEYWGGAFQNWFLIHRGFSASGPTRVFDVCGNIDVLYGI